MSKHKFYYYCPLCGNERVIDAIPRGAVPNIRDGWGRPIYHFECDKCHNLDAGAMSIVGDDPDDIEKYIQSVIEMYQGIRGIKIYIDESGENNASE